MNRRPESFRVWLRGQRKRDGKVGDLSRDFIKDYRIQKYAKKYHDDIDSLLPKTITEKSLTEYLIDKGACEGAINAVRLAWKEYREYLNG
jgi:hypothetical protein